MTPIKFTVFGKSQTRGSKSPWVPRRKDGSLVLRPSGAPVIAMMDSNKRSNEWMNLVRAAARDHYKGDLLTEALAIGIRCYFVRPKSHYRTGKATSHLLKGDAPEYPSPDFDKLTRAVLDALKGTIYRDDSQVCAWLPLNGKTWADGSPERCEIEIQLLRDVWWSFAAPESTTEVHS